MHRLADLFEPVGYLNTSATVIVMPAYKHSEQQKTLARTARCELLDRQVMVDKCGILKERLEPHLGPVKLVRDADGEERLVFHPREFRSSSVRRQREFEL